MKTSKINKDCLRGGCERWFYSQTGNDPVNIEECERCGWNKEEDARRKKIEPTLCKDGLRRIIIPAKPRFYMDPGGEKE